MEKKDKKGKGWLSKKFANGKVSVEVDHDYFQNEKERSDSDLEFSYEPDESASVTPPREEVRLKRKLKNFKFGFKSKDPSASKAAIQSQQKARWQSERKGLRDERQFANDLNPSSSIGDQDGVYPLLPKLVRVNSKQLRSVKHRKAVANEEEDYIPSTVISKAVKLDLKSKHSSKMHFYKSFALLVKLGGKAPYKERTGGSSHSEQWQVEYSEMLWLELQAWNAGLTVERQDEILEDERLDIFPVLNQVTDFSYTADDHLSLLENNKHRASHAVVADTVTSDSLANCDSLGNISEELGSSCLLEHHEISELAASLSKSHIGLQVTPTTPDKSDFAALFSMDLCGSINSDQLNILKAMECVLEMLNRVDAVERLYPSTASLAKYNPKYTTMKFIRNMQAMHLWLNILKGLYHTLHRFAEFIELDSLDMWQDWLNIGLRLHCLKTKQSYIHDLSRFPSMENPQVGLLRNSASRGSKRDRHNRFSHQRLSCVEPTSTSRYRPFVEAAIREFGLAGLYVRLKDIVHSELWKARCTMEGCTKTWNINLDSSSQNANFYDRHAAFVRHFPNLKSFIYSQDDFLMLDYDSNSDLKKACDEMGLPSYTNLYLFLLKAVFEISHECLRFRLDCKPTVDPSALSIRQLTQECKEVLSGSILAKHYYQDMALAVAESKRRGQKQICILSLDEFDGDLKRMLAVYFEYLEIYFQMSQTTDSASQSFKNRIEEEWIFVREICPYIAGGETTAGYKFGNLICKLLEFTSENLDRSVSKCVSQHNLAGDCERKLVLQACRNYKGIFKEVRDRALKALSFAKMLQKDLGVAASYQTFDVSEVIRLLAESSTSESSQSPGTSFSVARSHVMLECYFPCKYLVFVPRGQKTRQVLKVVTAACGIRGEEEGDEEVGYASRDYLILIRASTDKAALWKGMREGLHVSDDVKQALDSVQVEGVMLISRNVYQLNTLRRHFEVLFGDKISLVDAQTSSHRLIADSLAEMKRCARHLADVIIDAVERVSENLDLESIMDLDEADRNYMRKSFVESMQVCFGLGFEYLREFSRLYHGHSRAQLAPLLFNFAEMWVYFVLTRTERGRGTRPRWAAQGLEFLIVAIDPRNLDTLTEEQFKKLKSLLHQCMQHVVGSSSSKSMARWKERSSSPFSMHRARSVPTKLRAESPLVVDPHLLTSRAIEVADPGALALSITPVQKGSVLSLPELSSATLGDRLPSDENLDNIYEEEVEPPIVRIRAALQEIDERRTAKLQHMRVIGSVTTKKADLAKDLVRVTRRVGFKWQLGNKIGEGQFGKVYSCINLDTGELMAMKQVMFNPHDYGTMQEIADEITSIQVLQHDSLVKYYGVEVMKDKMLIFMEYCADGTIADVSKLGLPESMIRVYTYQIVRAIDYLHSNGVVHRDIKGANIFLSSSGLIKLGDFGAAVKLKNPMQTTLGEVFNTRGTAAYMAPEVITLDKGRGYGRAADIWSLGCVVLEMATGKQPWADCDNIYAIMYRVGDGHHPPIPDTLSEEGQDFLWNCFIHDQTRRWTAAMLEDHSFVKCC